MLTTYYVMITLGIVMLLSSLFDFGGDTEVGGVDVDVDGSSETSIFSMRTIAAGLLSFGLGAIFMYSNGFTTTWQVLVGFATSLVIGYLTYLFTRWIYSFQGNSSISLKGVIGKKGIITIGTTRNGTAQLRVDTLNGPREFTCKEVNETKLKISDNVKISNKIGNLLLVEK